MDTQRNHSATHLLHKALKTVLGPNVNQAGSEVSPEKLRFDFTHYEKLTDEQLAAVEKIVNGKIYEGLAVDWFESEIGEAKKLGATALFGEKYGRTVRVVKMGDYSMELCGGCHLKNTAFMGMFLITSESSVAAGVRRIEALTGRKAYDYVVNMRQTLTEAAHAFKTRPEMLIEKISDLHDENTRLSKEIQAMKKDSAKDIVSDLLASACDFNGAKCVTARVDGLSADEMRNLCDGLKDKLQSAVILLVSTDENKGMIIASATKDVVAGGFDCGAFIKKVAASVGGGGGGKPDMAQAGLKDVSRADEAVQNAAAILKDLV
jgi:alanyl-tRNA synthetase